MAQNLAAPPSSAMEHRLRAAGLRDRQQFAEAATELQGAAALFPDDPEVHAELGLTLTMAARPAEAVTSYERALDIKPDDTFILNNLGGTLIRLGRVPEAEVHLRRALALDPGHALSLRNLGVILKDSGRAAEARQCFGRALAIQPSLDVAIQAHLGLSPMARSREGIFAERAAYATGLEALAGVAPQSYTGDKINTPWFYLAYQDEDDLALVRRTAEVLSRIAVVPGASPNLSAWRPPAGARIRVAICSEFFHAHTMGRLYQGLIRRLDRSRFEVIVVHGAHSREDDFRRAIDELADRAVALPAAPAEQRQAISDLKPDVLFFPDIGMSAQTYFLAGRRLAPVQAVSWGHPNTTGLAEIDYFISAESIEPADADDSYGERLIRLPRLPAFYEAPPPAAVAPRSALRLPETGTLYGCPQSLFKLHPDFDAVLAAIAQGDPSGHIILIDAIHPGWKAVLKDRWARDFAILLERVTFLPRLSHEGFMAHLALIDVLLDPPHFGSGNTLYEAMSVGTPIVTWPGRFMRGRIVAGAYDQMGVSQPPVARTLDDYAAVALALGRDPARRAALRGELRAKARTGLFDDIAAVRAFETFLAAAVEAAGRDEILPRGWRAPTLESVDE